MSGPIFRAHPGPDGWINTVIMVEGRMDAEDEWPGVELDPALGRELLRLNLVVAHYDGEKIGVPRDDRILWRALRASGLQGADARGALATLRHLQAAYPDVPAGVAPPPPTPEAAPGAPDEPFRDVPGLRVRPLRPGDLDLMAPLAVETGVYEARCPEDPPCCSPPETHAWCQLAARIDREDTWQLALEFEGRPLQFELVTLDPPHPVIALTMHMTRERPHWFWREAERPVWNALRARGHRVVHSHTRNDRPDWIAALKTNYQALEVAELERVRVLEYSLEAAVFSGWPARRTVAGPIPHLREGTEADFPAVLALLEALPAPTRLRMQTYLREWWHLDRATLLLLHDVDGALRAARLMRPRRGTTAGLLLLSAVQSKGYEARFSAAMKAWARAAGYAEITGFVATRTLSNARMRAALQASGARVVGEHTRFREPFTEVSIAV